MKLWIVTVKLFEIQLRSRCYKYHFLSIWNATKWFEFDLLLLIVDMSTLNSLGNISLLYSLKSNTGICSIIIWLP